LNAAIRLSVVKNPPTNRSRQLTINYRPVVAARIAGQYPSHPMRRVAYALWILPAGPGRKSPRASSWRMNAAEAAALGALGIVPGTTEIRELPETDEERNRAMVAHPSAGHDAVAHAQPRAAPYPAPKA
jgi:hypothetical protein